MTMPSRREVAMQVISQMPRDIPIRLEKLAAKAHLTNDQMARFLYEARCQGLVQREYRKVTLHGASLQRTVYRRL